eukprot:jgi/Chrzof1/1066/Cz01g38310.t1
MTCEAQASALANEDGKVTKNLFLRDKKKRQYVITALSDTKVDIKVLSARLGLGKGGISWGSEELLSQSLQVEPGCVTPLAVANDTASSVLLLLDSKLQAAGKFYVHPITNTASVMLDSNGLDQYLRSINREPIYVDLEADPKIDKDNPPDLRQYADSIEPPKTEDDSNSAASSATTMASTSKAPPPAVTAPAASKPAKKGKGAAASSSSSSKPSAAAKHMELTNVVQRTDDLVRMVTEALLGKQPEELGVDGYTLQRLRADVQMQLTAFKNAAYTSGYTAGKQEVVAYATKQYV